MIRDSSFVITALQSWSRHEISNAQFLAIEISKHNRVLYVNPPTDMTSLLANNSLDTERKNRVMRGRERALKRINQNLWVLEPPIIIPSLNSIRSEIMFDALNRRNNRRYAEIIDWAMNIIGLDTPYFINDNDLFRSFYLNEYLNPVLSILYRRNNLTSLSSWRLHGKRLEADLCRRSDMVVTPNNALAEEVRGLNFNTFNIGQGVDFSGYSADTVYVRPHELQNMSSPVIGYVGTLGVLTVSPNLIYQLAQRYADASIVLIGEEDRVFMRHALHNLANVHFLGERSEQQVAQYIASFDVCINPEPRNEFTNSTYQPHIPHYLALGKSVVATATDAMFTFNGEVFLAGDDLHFLELVAAVLSESEIAARAVSREEFARTMTWESCVDRLYLAMQMVDDDAQDDFDPKQIPKYPIYS